MYLHYRTESPWRPPDTWCAWIFLFIKAWQIHRINEAICVLHEEISEWWLWNRWWGSLVQKVSIGGYSYKNFIPKLCLHTGACFINLITMTWKIRGICVKFYTNFMYLLYVLGNVKLAWKFHAIQHVCLCVISVNLQLLVSYKLVIARLVLVDICFL